MISSQHSHTFALLQNFHCTHRPFHLLSLVCFQKFNILPYLKSCLIVVFVLVVVVFALLPPLIFTSILPFYCISQPFPGINESVRHHYSAWHSKMIMIFVTIRCGNRGRFQGVDTVSYCFQEESSLAIQVAFTRQQ